MSELIPGNNVLSSFSWTMFASSSKARLEEGQQPPHGGISEPQTQTKMVEHMNKKWYAHEGCVCSLMGDDDRAERGRPSDIPYGAAHMAENTGSFLSVLQ